MTLAEILSGFIEYLYGFWPARIVNDWEAGIRMRAGQITAVLSSTNGIFGTGIHVFWPVVGEIQTMAANVEVNETPWQTHTISGRTIVFSLGYKYQVKNMRKLWTEVHDHEETVLNEVCSVAGACIEQIAERAAEAGPKANPLEDARDALPDLVKEGVGKSFLAWGLYMKEVSLFNLSEGPTLRLLGGTN